MDQETLARLLGVNEKSIGRWERGESLPSPRMLDMIADALNQPVHFFFMPLADDVKSGAHLQAERPGSPETEFTESLMKLVGRRVQVELDELRERVTQLEKALSQMNPMFAPMNSSATSGLITVSDPEPGSDEARPAHVRAHIARGKALAALHQEPDASKRKERAAARDHGKDSEIKRGKSE